ncbi:MAG: CDC48 family AAA ATPase [Methanophagales archaeon]|nr:CDC48 family AAA ATPase [Methanophagales archaeon]
MKDEGEEENAVTLRVAEAYHRDAGRGIARIDAATMRMLGLVSGDVIEVEGKNTATGIVWPGYSPDNNKSLVRIDGNIRSNAGVAIDDRVLVRKTIVQEAKRVILEPTQPVKVAGGERYLAKILKGRPITKGQIIRVEMLGNPISFIVTNTLPSGTVMPDLNTEFVLRKAREGATGVPHIAYEDIGGLQREISLIREMIELPLRHPELFERLGIEPPKGVLLHGPPGTGKTLIAKAVANETDANFYSISGPEIMSKFYGESEKHLRDIFEDGSKTAPSIIFIDELDSIAPKRGDTTGEVERRVVAQLLSLMDGLVSRGQVVVVGATNRPNALDEALRRGGRFDREIEIGIPNRNGREEVLQVHTRGMPLAEDVNLEDLAKFTHGFVGADLATLCKEAAMHALRKILPEIDLEKEIPQEVMDKLEVTKEDFSEALKNTEPSALREVFVEVPNVKWDDIGGMARAKQELKEVVEWPLKYPDVFTHLNSKPPKGILLFGAPGTGKTMLVKAVANESESNFISIKGPELLSKWVGESEKAVREIFRKAKQAAPCIIFLDELDSITPVRGAGYDAHVTERVVSQMLTEMDGLEELKEVIVIGATNRPDMVDSALLRPGRLDRLIYIPPPDKEEREKIFEVHLTGKPLGDDVDAAELAELTEGYVGADIAAIVKEAVMSALREFITEEITETQVKEALKNILICKKHFETAIHSVRPTITPELRAEFSEKVEDFVKYAYA